jgi:signal peptidase I
MEIVTAPYRPAPSSWIRLLVALAVFAPVTLLSLLPIGFGLERYVVAGDSMAPSIGRGSVVLERRVPVSSLRVGDVITFRPPASAGVEGLVTHRIVSLADDEVQTQGDADPVPDPWQLRLDQPSQARVVAALPYVGHFYLALMHPGWWTVVAVISLAVLVRSRLASARRRRSRGRDV